MHQFVVKLTAVTSLNRMLQGLEPFTETAFYHDGVDVPFINDTWLSMLLLSFFHSFCLFCLFFTLHYVIHYLLPYELCGNFRGRHNNIKVHLLVNMQASVVHLLILVFLLDQWDQLLWVTQPLKDQIQYHLDVNQDLWHPNVLDNLLFQENVDQFKQINLGPWGQQLLASQFLRFNANHIKVAIMDNL